MASRQFSFKERQAKLVADTIASTYTAGPLDLLKVDAPESKNYVTFRYQGGTMVRVFLFDVGTFQVNPLLHPSQEWVVYMAIVRWNNRDGRHESTMWPEDIRWVSGMQYVHSPRIVPLEGICGSVNVYHRGSRWFVTDHPELVVSSAFTMVSSIKYWPLIEGDLERALAEAVAIIPSRARLVFDVLATLEPKDSKSQPTTRTLTISGVASTRDAEADAYDLLVEEGLNRMCWIQVKAL